MALARRVFSRPNVPGLAAVYAKLPHEPPMSPAAKERAVPVPMPLPILSDPSRIAFFLDFDGTLVELAERPDAVQLAARTRDALTRLVDVTAGAVAIVTGREIADLDRFVAPLRLPAAGIHGLTRRGISGESHAFPLASDFLERAEIVLAPFVLGEAGLLLERKSNAIALHYRSRPELERACGELMESLAAEFSGIQIKRGKMVFEAKPTGANKGTAILDFLKEPPFADRQPLFVGDDVTDEDAFAAVNAIGGISIKIGPGITVARHRAESTAAFLDWLYATALALHEQSSKPLSPET